jgi:hypothetical protein
MSVQPSAVPDRWGQVEKICSKALDLPAGERASLLDEACAGDPDLRREVESLLAGESDAASFSRSAPAKLPPTWSPKDQTSISLAAASGPASSASGSVRAGWATFIGGATKTSAATSP